MQIIAAILLIAVLVFIHEFGHFVVAKACGVNVPVFSIGFGRRLVGFEYRGTDYRISALPFGGYVQMAGADPFGTGEEDDDLLEDLSTAFLRRPIWQRLLVVLAGPAFNLLLPLVVFTGLYMGGDPQLKAELGSVNEGTVAGNSGLESGDEVLSVNGLEVLGWSELGEIISSLEPGAHEFLIDRNGTELSKEFVIPEGGELSDLGLQNSRPSAMIGVDDPNSPAGQAGLKTGDIVEAIDNQPVAFFYQVDHFLGDEGVTVDILREDGLRHTFQMSPPVEWAPTHGVPLLSPAEAWGLAPATLFVASVESTLSDEGGGFLAGCTSAPVESLSTPAADAGIQAGDRILRIDDNVVKTWGELLDAVGASMDGEGEAATARPLNMQILREGQVIEIELTPEVVEDTDQLGRYVHVPRVGIKRMGENILGPKVERYYGFGEALSRSVSDTVAITGFILEQIGKLLTGEAAVEKSLGGPVEMVRQAKTAVEQGLFEYARLMALLSISLGIVNLLPVPVLDGGQALFFTLEAIRGRPVSVAFRERAQQIGVLFLVVLMLAVLVMDINRLFQG